MNQKITEQNNKIKHLHTKVFVLVHDINNLITFTVIMLDCASSVAYLLLIDSLPWVSKLIGDCSEPPQSG